MLDDIHHKLATYSILINGKPHGNITPSRDFQQGNPLSPYLYMLCIEGLHGLIQKIANIGNITGISIRCNGPRLTHLLFANDSLVFLQGQRRRVL